MRLVIMVAAFGFALGAPVMAPTSMMNVAEAQVAVSQQEMTLQAQIVALAQAGDTAGLRALMAAQVRAGNGAVLARVARRVGALAQQIAASDPASAAALVNAAVIVASDASVSAADPTVSEVVGVSAASVASTVQDTDPSAAASIQTTVAVEGNSNLQVGFVSGPTTTTTTDTSVTQPTGNTRTVVVRRPVPVVPTEPVVPEVPEPNPTQSGSPT